VSLLDDLVTAVGATRTYKLNEVPTGSPVYPYAVVGLTSPDKVNRTLDGQAGDLHRATVQFFGRDIDGVLAISAAGDLDGKFLGERLVTREVSTTPYRDPDDGGVLVVTHTYRF
jgi:hypothetical protein